MSMTSMPTARSVLNSWLSGNQQSEDTGVVRTAELIRGCDQAIETWLQFSRAFKVQRKAFDDLTEVCDLRDLKEWAVNMKLVLENRYQRHPRDRGSTESGNA